MATTSRPPMKDYRTYSFWLETCGDDLTPRSCLQGPKTVDVGILGAGYSGLWTAYYLLRQNPSLNVAVLEKEIAGYGASGRNGGWCTSGFSVGPSVLAERFGHEAARNLQLALYGAVDEVGRVCQCEGIDAQFRKAGALRIARGTHQLPAIEQAYEAYAELGLEAHYRLLTKSETEKRLRVRESLGSLLMHDCAFVHPGRLVRGLARAVERKGGSIYEQTQVLDFRCGSSPCLITKGGVLRAKTVVLAGEAYLTRFKTLHRQLIPLYSLIVLTEPLSQAQWSQIGWEGGECVSSNRLTVDYLSRTDDGRILFGSRGEPYHFGSRIEDKYDRHEDTIRMIQSLIRAWFPMLSDVTFTHTWGGPVGMPRDWMPTVRYDEGAGVASARGYTGQGVSASNLAGRLLADLITGRESSLSALPLNGHESPNWEPEPFRTLGVRGMQLAFARIDAKAERSGRPPSRKSLPERLGRH